MEKDKFLKNSLRVEKLGKRYGKRPVVRDVSLEICRGEIVGLLGPNGAGKTTTFSMICGSIFPDVGRVFLDQEEVTHLPMYRRARLGIGYLPQESSVFRGLTVEENLRAVLETTSIDSSHYEGMVESLLGEFMIEHLRHVPSLALSGGERRRVEIARALALGPTFMLLDEPLAGIDPIAVRDIRELILHLKKRGLGILITDHNVRDTLDIVDRAYIIADGKVLMEGPPSQIVDHEDVRRVYLGESFTL